MKDDARAVASALAGNREGFRDLFERHRKAVERVVAGFAELEDSEAQDLVVESFGRAFGQLGSLREPGRFDAWLLGLTRRRCRSRLARKKSAEAISADLATATVLLDLAPDPGPAAVDLQALIEALPAGPEKDVARLFHGEERPTARRVGETLHMTSEAVSRHLEHLRSRVKARLVAALLARRARGEEGPAPAHLDATLWNYVLRGERFRGERALAEHLGSECPVCEAFLMGLQGTDGLDGDVERALVGKVEPAPLRSDYAFEQAMRSLALHLRVSGASAPGMARPQPAKGPPLAVAAVLAILGLGVLALQHGPRPVPHSSTSTKPAIALDFSVAERGKQGGGEKGTAGSSYGQDHVVYLRYELASAAFVTLLRIAPDGKVEVLSQAGRVGPGPHVLSVNGSPAGVSLQGFPGRNRFVAVASPAPIPAESLVALFTAFSDDAAAVQRLEGSAVARFDVEVEVGDAGG